MRTVRSRLGGHQHHAVRAAAAVPGRCLTGGQESNRFDIGKIDIVDWAAVVKATEPETLRRRREYGTGHRQSIDDEQRLA